MLEGIIDHLQQHRNALFGQALLTKVMCRPGPCDKQHLQAGILVSSFLASKARAISIPCKQDFDTFP